MNNKPALLASFFSLLALSACESAFFGPEVANRLASPAWMVERQIPAGPFTMTLYERMHERHEKANIYIEGNPDDLNPIALHLASKDNAANLAYIALPCQYSVNIDKKACTQAYQSADLQTLANAYGSVINDIKKRYDIKSINLIGFGDGAPVAATLAAQRGDVASLRTVAGRLDLAAGVAPHLREMPQIHFAGRHDEIVPASMADPYMRELEPSQCATFVMVEDAAHIEGWVNQWPELLAHEAECAIPPRPALEILPERPRPVYRPREPDLEKGKGLK